MKLTIEGKTYSIEIGSDTVTVDGTTFKVKNESSGDMHTVLVDGKPYKVDLALGGNTVVVDGKAYKVALEGKAVPAPVWAKPQAAAKPAAPELQAPETGVVKALMPGKVVAIKVKEGDTVAMGTILLILEAMKMENEIRAPIAGVVRSLPVSVGSNVDKGDTLVIVG